MNDEELHDELLHLVQMNDGITFKQKITYDNELVFEIHIENAIIYVSEECIKYNNDEIFPSINVLYNYIDMELNGSRYPSNDLQNILEQFK